MSTVRRRRPRGADDAPTIIFLHIGKTAGLSLRMILRRQFPASRVMDVRNPVTDRSRLRREGANAYFAALPESERSRPRLIMGHATFGIHEHIPRPSTYITLLRDPVSLNVSLYHYIRRTSNHVLHERIKEHPTLDSFLRSGISLETDNSMTRAIAGDTSAPFGGCTEEMLAEAKRHIETNFSLVGFTERFDESLMLLGRAFGWSNLHYVPVNVAGGQQPREPVSDDTIELIRRQNRLDVELFGWATARFDAAIAADPGFGEDLRRFRVSNRRYRPWGTLTYSWPKRAFDRVAGLAGTARA
jgi:Galactose-3-O-sulfotransferase